jgi:hypothetical protein
MSFCLAVSNTLKTQEHSKMNFSRFFHIATLGISIFSSEILSATSHEDDLPLRKKTNAQKALLANDAPPGPRHCMFYF